MGGGRAPRRRRQRPLGRTHAAGRLARSGRPAGQAGKAKVDADIVATACFARSLRLVADAAALLGHDADAARYSDLAERSRRAFVSEYVTPAGRMMSDAPTAYALALTFDLVEDPETRRALADRLAALVREGGYRIGTGFVGTPLVADALSDGGHLARPNTAAAADRVPVMAVPRHHGRHRLGALGQHAAGRVGEPRRDDLVSTTMPSAPWPTGCTAPSPGSPPRLRLPSPADRPRAARVTRPRLGAARDALR